MKSKSSTPLLKKQEDGLCSFSVRRDYSVEDIQKLMGEMDSVISEYKAGQKGIDPENMVKTIRGGKTVWITKEEMNEILSKRRRIFKTQKLKPSQEPDQPSSELQKRLEICQNLIDVIRLVSTDQSLQFVKLKLNFEAVINQSLSQARDVRMIELALQRKKEEEPIIKEMENANDSILRALDSQNLLDASISNSFQERHFEEYISKQKRIEPYEKKAQENKQAYMETQLKVYQIQFDLTCKACETMSHHLDELLYHDKEGIITQETIGFHKTLQELITERFPFIQKFKQCSINNGISNGEVFQRADSYLKQLFTQLGLFIENFKKAWITCAKKVDTPQSNIKEKEKLSATRMTYQRRARQGDQYGPTGRTISCRRTNGKNTHRDSITAGRIK